MGAGGGRWAVGGAIGRERLEVDGGEGRGVARGSKGMNEGVEGR
jgi:hypothetical protein